MKTFIEFLLLENRLRFDDVYNNYEKIVSNIVDEKVPTISQNQWYGFIYENDSPYFPITIDDIPDRYFRHWHEFKWALREKGYSDDDISNILNRDKIEDEFKTILEDYLDEKGYFEDYDFWYNDVFPYINPIKIEPFKKWYVKNMIGDVRSNLFDIKQNSENNKITIYRAMDLRSDWEEWIYQHKNSHVGLCWAYKRAGADTYSSEAGTRPEHNIEGYNKFIIIGEIDLNSVDWDTTLLLMVETPDLWNDEMELRLYKAVPIKLLGVINSNGETSELTKGIQVRA